MLIFGADRHLARWAGERLNIKSFGPCCTIGVVRNENIAAVLVYSNYSPPNNIEMSLATSTPYWSSREVLGAIFRYPFVQLGCKRVTAVMAEKNTKGREFVTRLGFRQEGEHPYWFAEDNGVSYGLLACDAARWIQGHKS